MALHEIITETTEYKAAMAVRREKATLTTRWHASVAKRRSEHADAVAQHRRAARAALESGSEPPTAPLVPASWERVAELSAGARRDPAAAPQHGASSEQLDDLAARLGRVLPEDLVRWLRILNGDAIGQGGVFGARVEEPFLDVAAVQQLFGSVWPPDWLPVASDGCGNFYVLRGDGTVGFIDTMKNPAVIEQVVCTSLVEFLQWYVTSQ